MNLQAHFASVGRELGAEDVTARFSPFSELKHTWVRDKGGIEFKISDYLERSSDDVIESLAWYLLSRALGRKCGADKTQRYLDYARSRELWTGNRERYIERSRHLALNPRGDHRDLLSAYSYVNSYYFAGKLPHLQLAWARESPRRRLGYYFDPLQLLAVNKALDSEEVPRYVLEFVIFHEMLHHVDSASGRRRRRVHHTKHFNEQERKFTHYEDAERWLRRIVARTARRR